MKAYVMIKSKNPQEMKKYLENIKQIEEVHTVYGGYDLVVEIRAKDILELGEIIMKEIRERFPVEETITLIVAD